MKINCTLFRKMHVKNECCSYMHAGLQSKIKQYVNLDAPQP